MTYKEHIYHVCNATDLDDKDDVIETMQYLAKELMEYREIALRQDGKMKEIMTAKDYDEWSTSEAKEMFRNMIEGIEDGEYKDFCLEHFDEITGGNK